MTPGKPGYRNTFGRSVRPGRRSAKFIMSDMASRLSDGPHLRTIAMPRDTNAAGAIFGGWTVSQMDLAGGTLASQRAKGRVATVSIDAMRFLRPIAVGDEVSCYCTLQEESGTSFGVKVEVWIRDRTGGDAEKVTEGLFTYVAVDDEWKPRQSDDG